MTTPGAKFGEPITLNIYSVGGDGTSVGQLLASQTKEFEIPYRPSADPTNCPGNPTQWFDGTSCFNGMSTPIAFDLTSATLTLPDNIIVSVAYDTETWGYEAHGANAPCEDTSGANQDNCGYDSLNVGLNTSAPATGTYVNPGSAYQNSQTGSNYGDGGTGGVDIFRYGSTGWSPYEPSIRITTSD